MEWTAFQRTGTSARVASGRLRAEIHRAAGFTLLELIIALLVLAVLLSIGAPSFSNLLAESRLREQHRGLISTLRLARTEAEQRGVRVVVCARASDTACGSDWRAGWIAFVDELAGTPNALDAGESVLRRQSPTPHRRVFLVARQRAAWATQTLTTTFIAVEPRARGATTHVVFCDARGAERALTLVIDPSGAIRTSLGHDANGDRLDPWSSPLECPSG